MVKVLLRSQHLGLQINPLIKLTMGGSTECFETTMIYTHCVPVRTVKEPKSPLDF
jgi:hypothetical protein